MLDGNGNLFFIDGGSHRVVVRASGTGSIAGLPQITQPVAGVVYALAAQVTLDDPTVLFVDGEGITIVTNRNGAIQVIDPRANITDASGAVPAVVASSDRVSVPPDLAELGSTGTPGTIQTVAGILSTPPGSQAIYTPGDATQMKIAAVRGVAVDTAGNLYYSDYTAGHTVRVIYAGGTVPPVLVAEGITQPTTGWSYIVAGNGQTCTAPAIPCGDGGPALSAGVAAPWGIAVDASGNIFIADSTTASVREVTAADGNINTVAGTLTSSGYVDGPVGTGKLATVTGVAVDSLGNLYIADATNNVIRFVYNSGPTPAALTGTAMTQKFMYTIAGVKGSTCTAGTTCNDGGRALAGFLSQPQSVAVDGTGNIYIADTTGNRIRKVDAQSGNISTVVGNGTACSASPCGDGGPASAAQVATPTTVSTDALGNLYVVDQNDSTIRKVDTSGNITAIAGVEKFTPDQTGDGGPATSAHLNKPYGVAVDNNNGNLYFGDATNFVIRVVYGTPTLRAQTITFNQPSPVTYGVGMVNLTASSDSNLAVTFTVNSGPGTIANGNQLTVTGAGTIVIEADQAGNTTYAAATPVTENLVVTPATVTITPNRVSVPFGAATNSLPLSYTASGLVGSADTLTGTPTYSVSACSDGNATYTATTAVGTTCTISISQGSLTASTPANYSIQAGGTAILTVTGGGAQTIDFPSLTGPFTYGQSAVALHATASSGQPVTYTSSNTNVAVVTGSNSLTFTGAGTATITAHQEGNAQFAPATDVSQVVNVGRATIKVQAADASVSFGTSTSALASMLTATVTGFVGNGDTYTGSPSLSSNGYTPTSTVGSTFTITPAQGTLAITPQSSANNYTITYLSGNGKVTQQPQTITFPQPLNETYGQLVSVNATSSAGSNYKVVYTFTGPVTGGIITGVGQVTVIASQPGDANVAAAAPVTRTFTAVPAVLTVQGDIYYRAQGAPNPTFQYTITGFQNSDTNNPTVLTGVPYLTTAATPASPPGVYPIVVQQGLPNVNPQLGPLTAANYTFQFVNGSLMVLAAPSITLTASNPTLNIPQGQSASTPLVFDHSGYMGSVTLSCGNLPLGMSCTFDPATITFDASSNREFGSVTISTNTITPVVGATRAYLAGFLSPGLAVGGLLFWNRRKFALRSNPLRLGIVLLGLLAGIGLSGCGTSDPNNVAAVGTRQILITASATGAPDTGSPNLTTFLYLTVNVTP